MIAKYTKKQWLILIVYSFVNLFSAFSISLQGPFYPAVAESKGATTFQNGIVFGAFGLVLFFISALYGIIIDKFGIIKVSFCGLLIIGVSNILFGFVDRLNGAVLFISISIMTRIFEGIGFGMVRNSGITIISCEFSENVEIAFAIIQSFFSTGLLLGPVIGGALYELGGFYLPFVLIGILLLCISFIVLLLPTNYPKQEPIFSKQIVNLLKQPSIILGTLTVFGAFLSFSFFVSILELHVKSLNLSPVQVGAMFLCNGIAFTLSPFFWSILCEKYNNLYLFCSLAAFICATGILLLGPAPYFHFDLTLYSCIFGLLINGIGLGGEQVISFSILNKGAFLAGFSKSIQTSGIVSTLFTSFLALGTFIGPIIGGYMFETIGFPWGSHIFIVYHFALSIAFIIYNYLRSKIEIHEKIITLSTAKSSENSRVTASQ